MDNFNKEAFIDEVEKRPVIWDTDCPEYFDRILKKKAWEELTEIFADPSYSKEKKSMFNMQLQRKWKNLRDTYIKEYKKITNSSYEASRGSHYIYYAKLSFLQKCLKKKVMASSNDNKDMDTDQISKTTELLNSLSDSVAELLETASSMEKPANRSKSSESSHELFNSSFNTWGTIGHWKTDPISPLSCTYEQSSSKPSKDHDKLFCLSLYKEIRKVPEHNRLNVKIELLRVLRMAQMFPLNETKAFHEDFKPNTSTNWTDLYFEKRFPTSNPGMERKEIPLSYEELINTIKPLMLSFGQLMKVVDLSLSRKRKGDRNNETLRYLSSSTSDSSLSSDSSTFHSTKMQTD